MNKDLILGFGTGVVVASVVLVGLYMAMREFISLAQNPEFNRKNKIIKTLVGLMYFLGQIAVAVAVFFYLPLVQEQMVSVGVGLVSTLLLSSFFLRSLSK